MRFCYHDTFYCADRTVSTTKQQAFFTLMYHLQQSQIMEKSF